MSSIAIVDDNPTALAQMRLLLNRAGFRDVRGFNNPKKALHEFRRSPPGVLLVDYMMPDMDGLQLLDELMQDETLKHLPVAMVTGYADLGDVRLPALRAGVLQIISKPVKSAEFVVAVRNLERMASVPLSNHGDFTDHGFQPLVVPRKGGWMPPASDKGPHDKAVQRMMDRVSAIHDEATGDHCRRMAHYAAAIAHRYGFSVAQQDQLLAAAPLHDIGKVAIPTSILLKPTALTSAERLEMETHTVIGHELLYDESFPLLALGAEIALSHHERWDGSGYPHKLVGDDIPVAGRIVAMADVFDALTTVRPYKPIWPIERAVQTVQLGSGRQFDPDVVRAFTASLDDCLRIKRFFDGAAPQPGRVAIPGTGRFQADATARLN